MAIKTSLFLLLLGVFNSVIAFDLTGRSSPALERRLINAAGGWPANAFNAANNTDCPAGNTYCFGGNCCPSSLTCVGTGDPVNCVCCPEDSDCETTFQQNPVCADSSWNLWNATTQGQYGGFFCCQQGQVGDNTGGCWPPGTALAATDRAISLTSGTTNTSTTHSVHSAGKAKLSEKVIIGIAVGAGVLVILLALVVGCCCWKCFCKKGRSKSQEVYNPSYEPYRQQ